jgi:23S rRNA (cytosine1962-C5)-methyltransferase
MSISPNHLILKSYPDYELLDSGDGMKFERYGTFKIARPESQALWSPKNADWNWDAFFDKSRGGQGKWAKIPDEVRDWVMSYGDLSWQCRWSPYRHVGVFPEQAVHWDWMREVLRNNQPDEWNKLNVLNLFAYTGIASIACAKEWAKVTHVDGSKPTIGWAQKNMELSELPKDSIRWILEDVVKFVDREVRRGNTYDGFIMDPPVFGHGANGEKWEFDTSFPLLLESIKKIISPNPLFFLVNTYASSIFSTTLANILADILPPGTIEHGELGIQESKTERSLTTGVYARWRK